MVIASEVTGSGSPADDAQPSGVDNFSFADVHAKAMAFGASSDAVAVDTPQVTTPVEQVTSPESVETPQAEVENVDNPTAAQIAALKDDDLVEVTVGGQVQQLAWKDAKAGIMRQQDYTRKTQDFRREQAEFNQNKAKIAEQEKQFQTLVATLTNADQLAAFIQQAHPALLQKLAGAAAVKPQGPDPDDIPTVADVRNIQQSTIEQVRAEIAQEIKNAQLSIHDQLLTQKVATDINNTIGELFASHREVVDLIPNIEDVLRYNVYQMQPQTPEETVEAFKTVFGGWVEKYNQSVMNAAKQKVIAKAGLVNNNIQPSGGTQVQPTPIQTYDSKSNKVDWKAINAAAMAFIGDK